MKQNIKFSNFAESNIINYVKVDKPPKSLNGQQKENFSTFRPKNNTQIIEGLNENLKTERSQVRELCLRISELERENKILQESQNSKNGIENLEGVEIFEGTIIRGKFHNLCTIIKKENEYLKANFLEGIKEGPAEI